MVTIGAFLTTCRPPDSRTPRPLRGPPRRRPCALRKPKRPCMAAPAPATHILVIERDEDPGLPPRGYTDILFLDEPCARHPRLRSPDSIEDLADSDMATSILDQRRSRHAPYRAFPIHAGTAPYTTYEAARVRARTGSTILPAMALAGAHTEGAHHASSVAAHARSCCGTKNHGYTPAAPHASPPTLLSGSTTPPTKALDRCLSPRPADRRAKDCSEADLQPDANSRGPCLANSDATRLTRRPRLNMVAIMRPPQPSSREFPRADHPCACPAQFSSLVKPTSLRSIVDTARPR